MVTEPKPPRREKTALIFGKTIASIAVKMVKGIVIAMFSLFVGIIRYWSLLM